MSQEQQILTSYINGTAHISSESQFNVEVKWANAVHNEIVGEHSRGGLGGFYGFKFGGEKGGAIGSQANNLSLCLHCSPKGSFGSRASEPSKAERQASLLELEVNSSEFKPIEFNSLNDPRAYELASSSNTTTNISRVFKGNDALTTKVANAIEKSNPGSIVAVEQLVYKSDGKTATDFDIVTKKI